MFSRQVKLLAPGQIPVFQRLPFRGIEALPKLRAPAKAEFGETARDHRSADLEVCPKIAQTSGRAGISSRFVRRRALGTPRQSRQHDKAPDAHLDSIYLVHRRLDTSDLKEAKSVLHDLRNPGGATR